MTESGSTPHYSRGTGYHAFRGPRPVAWGQRLFSDADWECSHLNFLIIYQKDIMGLHYDPSLTSYFSHALYKKTYNSQNSGISGGPGPVVGAAELTGGGGGGGGGGRKDIIPIIPHYTQCFFYLVSFSKLSS